MADFSWWELGNKVGNLLVLVGACWYGIQKYLIPYATKELTNRARQLTDLTLQTAATITKREQTLTATEEQRKKIVLLLEKITVWKQVLRDKEAAALVERREQEQKTHLYLKKRADGLCSELLKKTVTPRIIAQTTKQVTAHFASEQHKQEYLASIMNQLKKGK